MWLVEPGLSFFTETPPHQILVSKVSNAVPVVQRWYSRVLREVCGNSVLRLLCLGWLASWPSPTVGGWVGRWWEHRGGYVRKVFPETIGRKRQSLGKISLMSWVEKDFIGLAIELASVDFAAISWLANTFIFILCIFYLLYTHTCI